MSRPRIRSLKPEVWEDEKVGQLSHSARLLFIGLITLADDEGRFRALPAVILGHVFPYDGTGAARRLEAWMEEIVASGLIGLYDHNGLRYGVFPKWGRHQRINRMTASSLPEPRKLLTAGSRNGQ